MNVKASVLSLAALTMTPHTTDAFISPVSRLSKIAPAQPAEKFGKISDHRNTDLYALDPGTVDLIQFTAAHVLVDGSLTFIALAPIIVPLANDELPSYPAYINLLMASEFLSYIRDMQN